MNRYNRKPKESLCWKCRNAIPSKIKNTGCDWSEHFEPVEGWTVKKKRLTHVTHNDSYFVIKCPEFDRG